MPSEWENNSSSSSAKVSSSSASSLSASSSTATSPEPNANGNNNNNSNNDSAKNGHGKDGAIKSSIMSHDPTSYVARARVTRPTPPKPSCNPMQFVQIKPCNLYQSAQQQLKKAEEIKKVKEVLKEEPEDWQNNLDNWKSSRRKRVEHIIDRVVEVKKLEQEEHDRTRRKSKTFSEMMEERGERGRARPKLQSLASYNEDETNDLSDLGIGTSSASGKSSISEDCEVHSIVSEPPETENISSFHLENNSCQPCHDSNNRDRISSPGYETSSTAPVASPDPYEYTYEGAIEDYKSRVSKASASSIYNKPGFTGSSVMRNSVFDRKATSIDSENDAETSVSTVKKEDLPKIDISKKRELFEKPEITKKPVSPSSMQNQDQIEKKRIPSEFANVRSIKDRLCSLEKKSESADEPTTGILSGEICSIKERLQCLEQQKQQNSVNPKPNTNKVVAEVVAVPPLKDRLSSLQNAVTKEEVVKKPIVLVDEYQLEMLKNEELARRQLDTIKDGSVEKAPSDDSGINTTDEKIDHEPATTTEDEDDDEEVAHEEETIQLYEEKVPIAASTNEFQGEFDSSVSFLQLKNLNPSTVVSLVEKPVVSDVGGGNALFDSGKDYRTDQDGEVNHAQNLLKMFKMAFKDDVVDEKKNSESVKTNIVDQNRKEELGLVKTKENQASLPEPRVPWRRVRESSESEVKISKIPQPKISSTIEDTTKTSVVQSSKTPQSSSSTVASDVGISINPQNNVGITEFGKKPVENSSRVTPFKKVASIEEILGEDSAAVVVDKSPKVVTPEVEIEIVPSSSRYGAKPHDLVQNLILNIDNSQKKSMIPIPSKIQSSTPKPDVQSPKFETRKIPTPVTPKTPPTSAARSPQNSPVYENVPHDIDISHPSCVGLKKVSSPQNHGRVEIFNSRSMPEKPKSPEVLPKGIKASPNESMKSEVQSKDFQQSAMDDFIKDLESWQPKIVGEQPKQIYEITPTKIISEKPIEAPEIVKETVEVGKTIMDSKGPLIDSVISSTPISLEKENPVLNNLQTQGISKLTELASDKDTKSSKPIKTAEKSIANENSPLPFESCVDILQSFLAAERSYPGIQGHSPNEPQLAKKSKGDNSAVSEGYLRQETVVEVPCSKIDVKDLPDPNFIKTPCIDVDCREKSNRVSTISSQAQVRDSLSSAGDSSPSSEITVIFKPKGDSNPIPGSQTCPIMDVSKTVDPSTIGSPKPNPSSLLQIANRVNSPIAGRRNPPPREKTVCEEPCLKLNVNDLPDPNFIRTPCIEVEKSSLSQCAAAPRPNSPSSPQVQGSQLHKANAEVLKKTCDDLANSPPLSPVLGGSPSGDKPNFLIARVEVVETKIKVTTTNDTETPPAVPVSAPPQALPGSPKLKPKSVENLKPKNIFEFIKKNFQSKPEVTETPSESDEFEPISVDNSKFYVPSDVPSSSSDNSGTSKDSTASDAQGNNGVNIEITKTITTDSIVEQTDAELNLTNEIDEILDEEISKLVVEDAKL